MPAQAPQPLDEVLTRATGARGDARVVLLGSLSDAAAHPVLRHARPATARDILDSAAGAGPADGRFDLAVVADTLEHLPRDDATRLLASLRDVWARRVLVLVPLAGEDHANMTHWSLADMLAHGLESLGTVACADRTLALFGFDIDHYKRTPDWLSARNWANPELWNRYRW